MEQIIPPVPEKSKPMHCRTAACQRVYCCPSTHTSAGGRRSKEELSKAAEPSPEAQWLAIKPRTSSAFLRLRPFACLTGLSTSSLPFRLPLHYC